MLLIVVGSLMLGKVVKYKTLDQLSPAPFAVLVALGVILLLLTFLPCCGAFIENTCMLKTVTARTVSPVD